MLVNGSTLRMIHMWRGYRDATMIWIKLRQEKHTCRENRIGLVIYAPRRGLLELWDLHSQYERLAAAHVRSISNYSEGQ